MTKEELISDAKKAGVSFTKNSQLFFEYMNGELCGVSALNISAQYAKLKFEYVVPKHRRKGILTKMIVRRINAAKQAGVRVVEAHCTKMSVNAHLRCGAKKIRVYKNNNTLVRYENIQQEKRT